VRFLVSRRLCLLAVAFVLAWPGLAAAEDVQLWTVATVSHALDDRFALHLAGRVRFDDDVSQSKDYLIRPYGSWKATDSISLQLGYDRLQSVRSRDEHSAWQSVSYRQLWRDLSLGHRIRLDERFVEGVGGPVVRSRYRLRGTHPLGSTPWYMASSDEVFVNLNDQHEGPVGGFEQNRLRVALGWKASRWRVEGGYEWHYARRRDRVGEHRHVFVLEFFYATR
jgi:hypothetical protein